MQMANHAVADQPRFISRFHLSVHRSVRKIKRNKKEREREVGREKNGSRRGSFTFKWTMTNEQLIRNYQPINAAFPCSKREDSNCNSNGERFV